MNVQIMNNKQSEDNNTGCGEVHKVENNKPLKNVSKRAIITTLVLVYINLLNYMDRFTVSSVLPDIQKWFQINKIKAGLLQTVFVCAYMVFAPIFGYLGDRYSRKYIMAIGISIWTITTLAGSMMGKDAFWSFFALRGLVGIGEASYSTVAPTIIADLFVGEQRSKALTAFFFAVPCGSGLGYIVGSKFSLLMGGQWQWALRVTPVLGIIAVLLTVFALHEPKRGAAESAKDPREINEISESIIAEHPSSFFEDLRLIVHIPSFVWSTAGFTCLSFVVGGLSWWAPEFALYSLHVLHGNETDKIDNVSYIFGLVTFAGGVIGVGLGAEIARRWKKTNIKADSLVCAYGILGSIPFLFFALYVADKQIILMWVLILLGEILMCTNWCPNGDLLLYVVPPKCRSTAEALQILLIHVLGDACSPFVVGLVSDAFTGTSKDPVTTQHGLLYSLYIMPFLCCFGAASYLICSRYIEEDKAKAENELRIEVMPKNYDCIIRPSLNLNLPDFYEVAEDDEGELIPNEQDITRNENLMV